MDSHPAQVVPDRSPSRGNRSERTQACSSSTIHETRT